ncbi:MAG: metallophosphoesterase [Notoacmeibacter sp.]|nr:metallophosphoesterase [Notoacmeibacter sp.]
MKIVHISDIHIHPEPILGHDPVENFRACLAHVDRFQADADLVIITGDLTDDGRPESYAQLKAMLAQSRLAQQGRLRLMIGNHDRRDTFRAAFPDAAADPAGFVQWHEETPQGHFIYMDTVQQGAHWGRYCEDRRAWLEERLDAARGAGAFLFLHHNPAPVHVANADVIGIREGDGLKTLLARHRATVRHLFFGHCHFTLSGTVAGIPFSAPRSTNHTCWPDFSGDPNRMGHGDLQPSYNVVFIHGDDVVVHTIDFLEEEKVKWV